MHFISSHALLTFTIATGAFSAPSQDSGAETLSAYISKKFTSPPTTLGIDYGKIGTVCSPGPVTGLEYYTNSTEPLSHSLVLPEKEAKEAIDAVNKNDGFIPPYVPIQEQMLSWDSPSTEFADSSPPMVEMEPKKRCIVLLNYAGEKATNVTVYVNWLTTPTATSLYYPASLNNSLLVERKSEPEIKPWLPWLTDGSKTYNDYLFSKVEPKLIPVKEKNPSSVTFDPEDKSIPIIKLKSTSYATMNYPEQANATIKDTLIIPPNNMTTICSIGPVGGVSYATKSSSSISSIFLQSEEHAKKTVDYYRGIGDYPTIDLSPRMSALYCEGMGFSECNNSNPPGQLMPLESMCLVFYNQFENTTVSLDAEVEWLVIKKHTGHYTIFVFSLSRMNIFVITLCLVILTTLAPLAMAVPNQDFTRDPNGRFRSIRRARRVWIVRQARTVRHRQQTRVAQLPWMALQNLQPATPRPRASMAIHTSIARSALRITEALSCLGAPLDQRLQCPLPGFDYISLAVQKMTWSLHENVDFDIYRLTLIWRTRGVNFQNQYERVLDGGWTNHRTSARALLDLQESFLQLFTSEAETYSRYNPSLGQLTDTILARKEAYPIS
ncbi:hypothetical protein BJ684DRAFT_20304 [Piptocephalis cylindrospora]|uniref:Uncharacterized protein n=1 Tax=Piptocephalis cylindrospora TaxID=1907219 RepID=A0A4V1IY36_9FUNG|nr:hypothetical protein BJ684DRAFT_20304 [Piptocephalis cylindrospora]|eukprot:RKP13189.1 hypothetical protein BJ684DRAFT_20304 [Piptocephalis cylindrospora]